MTVAPSGIRTDARGPTALMRDPLTTTTASVSGGPPFPSMTVQPTMASIAPWEPGAPVATRLTVSARPRRHNNLNLDINLLRSVDEHMRISVPDGNVNYFKRLASVS